MVGQELSADITEATPEAVADAFTKISKVLIEGATVEMIATIMGHSALETANWDLVRRHCFGHIKATRKWIDGGGDYCFFHASELLTDAWKSHALRRAKPRTDGRLGMDMEIRGKTSEGKWICLFWPSHYECRFRAFKTFDEGVINFLRKLTGKFRPALKHAIAGNPYDYVNEIHSLEYFTANLDDYRRSVVSLYHKYLPEARKAWLLAEKKPSEDITKKEPCQTPVLPAAIRVITQYQEGHIRLETDGLCRLTPSDAVLLSSELKSQAQALSEQLCLDHDHYLLKPSG
jgi:hypothetical protein